jgi:hypothetical protein
MPRLFDVSMNAIEERASVELYWIPLGAGANVVRMSGRVYERIVAARQRRPPRPLFHSALEVLIPAGRFVIEVTPIPDTHGEERGVVAEGPVGTRWLRRLRFLRYEIRRWREGRIPDVHEAIGSPVRVTDDVGMAQRILALVPSVPHAVWGRDELDTGDMWNSNSVVSWLLARSGMDTTPLRPPNRGRAPGWDAGLTVAARSLSGGGEQTDLPSYAPSGAP